MKELGITKGEWQFENYAGYFAIQNTNGYTPNDLLLSSYVGAFEAEHNAELICDAGNTAQKCGLLPSELLRQRDELLIALIDIRNKLYLTEKNGNICFEIAEAAIRSTER